MTYKVSLIIPAWNAAKTISDCILSAIKAKNSPSEIIIVDDCSNDNTVSIIKNLITKYPYIKLLELKKNVGPAAARDLGVAASTGDLIFFTDSDTIVLNNTFVNCLETIKKYKADAVSGIYHPDPINAGKTQLYKALFFYYHFARHKKPFAYETFNGQIAAIKKEVYLKTGGYNKEIEWGMDNENEEFGRRIIKEHLLLLDPNFQVRHNFPNFIKLSSTYFFRVSTWMYVFMQDLKFESGGPAAMDSGIAVISVPLMILFFLLGLIFSNIFFFISIVFINIWLYGYLKFFIFVYKNKTSFLLYSILLNLWFSSVISLGAFWGLLKWLNGQRLKKIN